MAQENNGWQGLFFKEEEEALFIARLPAKKIPCFIESVKQGTLELTFARLAFDLLYNQHYTDGNHVLEVMRERFKIGYGFRMNEYYATARGALAGDGNIKQAILRVSIKIHDDFGEKIRCDGPMLKDYGIRLNQEVRHIYNGEWRGHVIGIIKSSDRPTEIQVETPEGLSFREELSMMTLDKNFTKAEKIGKDA